MGHSSSTSDGRIVCCDVMHQQHTVWATNEIADRKLRQSHTLQAFADQMDNIWLFGRGTTLCLRQANKHMGHDHSVTV
jgi:hypothetical protein